MAVSPFDVPSPCADRSSPKRGGTAALLAQTHARLALPLWRAGALADEALPTASTGWAALDAALPGGGWPLAGLTELLITPASGELELLAPWLDALVQRRIGPRELVWVGPLACPSAAALQSMGLEASRLVLIQPRSMADAAWATEQSLRAGSCAAVLWWSEGVDAPSPPVALTTWRRLHLAAQTGATAFIALRNPAARELSSPAPLRLACTPVGNRRLAIEVFKRRGPPVAAPIEIALPWPVAARRGAVASAAIAGAAFAPSSTPIRSPRDAVDRIAPAASAPPSALSVDA